MKRQYYIAFWLMITSIVTAHAQSPTTSRNYVMETNVKSVGNKTTSALTGLVVDSANRSIQYLDGLGRPIQTVQWQGSPSKKDIVTHNYYDALGREATKYLPYAAETSSDGSFKGSPLGDVQTFYSTGSWDANVAKTPYPYSTTIFERSPLNRVLEQGAPGAVWQPAVANISGSGHTVKMETAFNGTGEVALWALTSSGAGTSGSYNAKKLSKSVVKDENWTSGKAGTVAEFKDTEGRVVLKRQWSSNSDSLSTYYVYDDYSNLRYVIPPAVSATSFAESDAVFKNFIYGYHYDGRKRLIEKKVPGKGWEHFVYNKLDQLVLSQDSVQRTANQWHFTKYDALGRQIFTGIVNSSSNRATWQADVDAQSHLWETRDDANANGAYMGYTNLSLPTSGYYRYFTLTYYDNYDFLNNPFGQPGSTEAGPGRTRGLLTGTRTLNLDNLALPATVSYYDMEGRPVRTKAEIHISGTDQVTNTYNFAGELTVSTRILVSNGSTTTIANSYAYDHMGRKVSTRENINSQGEVVLSKLEYNEIGQLKKKNLHSTNGGASFYQDTKFSYNERGWLRGSTSGEFQMKLGYDTLSNAQYNGNISTQLWGSGYANRFDYQYDRLNRLTSGTTVSGISMGEVLTYDAMGNILTMDRDGAGTATYSYTGNQLNSISGGGLTTGSYAYDGNGNAVTDGRNGTTVTYNPLNLPQTILKSGLDLAYTYDATGKKLRRLNSSTGIATDYVDGIQYTSGSIDFIQTEEGRAVNQSGTYKYEYNLTDHLGNVRYSFDIYSGAVRELQRDDYYAFGKRKAATAGTNNYLYNGKELQDGLGQYDYGARFYDPVIGRWNTVDPLAEKMNIYSPYNYVFNNPMSFIDSDGMLPIIPIAKWLGNVSTWIGDIPAKIATGKPTAGTVNISRNSVRFANRGDSESSRTAVLSSGESGEINAFRHTLWQAQIAADFGVGAAKRIGDSHEGNPDINLKQRQFGGIGARLAADQTVDLLNNMIGRSIGEENEGLGMRNMAIKVLTEFAVNGLYTSTKNKDGSFTISKSKITTEQFKSLLKRFQSLDNNGETAKERKERDARNRESAAMIMNESKM